MKVLCINDDNGRHPYLRAFKTYLPIRDVIDNDGEDCYEISGFPNTVNKSGRFNSGPYYKKRRFIPLSDIDETELVKERKNNLVNI